MKIKIIEVKKTYPPYALPNGGTSYSYGCKVIDHENNEDFAMITVFKEDTKVEKGIEFESEKNCGNIKFQMVNFRDDKGNQKDMKKYSIYAKKKEFDKKGGYTPRPRISKDHFCFIVQTCHDLSLAYSDKLEDATENAKLRWSWFSALLKGYLENVETKAEEKTENKVEETFGVASNDIPF